jgi:PAS domain S-box-containing protein
MDLRKKTLLNLALAIIIITAITIVFSSVTILKNYEKLESDQVTGDVNLVVNEINTELSGLNLLADTWGTWDDACAFVKGEYPDFIEKNFPKNVYTTYDINALVFTNTRGDILYSQGYNYDTGELEPVPPDILKELASGQSPYRPPNPGDGASGFLTTSKGPTFIASYPVKYSNFTGLPVGRVIIGKYIYSDEIEKYRLETVPSLKILPLDSPLVTPGDRTLLAESGDSSVLVRAEEGGVVAGYKVIEDVYGNNAVLVRIEKPRDIYHQGLHTVSSFILILLATGFLFGLLIFFLINKDILSRIREMDAEFGGIRSNGDISRRIKVTGDDELSRLGNGANLMLEQIEGTRQALMETEVLRASEIKYRELIEFLPQMVFEMDAGGTFTFINQVGLQSTGYTQEDIDNGLDAFRFVVPEDNSLVRTNIRRILAGEKPGAMEYTLLRKDGSRIPVIVYADAIILNNAPVGIKGAATDITEYKRAEELLKESERKFRDIFNNVNDAIHMHGMGPDGRPGRFIDVNEVACRMLQYSRDEILAHSPLDFATDYHSRPLARIQEELVTTGHAEFETGHTRKDGTIVPVEINAHVISLQGKKVVLSVVRDITQRKRVEKALEDSQEFLNKIINTIGDPIHVKDRQHRIILINEAACRLFNLPREKIIGKTAHDLFFGKEMADISWQKDEEVFRTGKESVNEETNTYAEGKTLTVLVKKTLFTDTAGNQFLVGITTDITELKKAQIALRESEEQYRSVVENIQDIYYRTDNEGTIIMASPSTIRILGYSSLEEIIGKPIERFWVDPGCRKEMMQQIRKHGRVMDYEVLIRKPDGTSLPVAVTSTFYRDHDGSIQGVEGIIRDITDRKQMELTLKESERRMKDIISFLPDATFVIDKNGTVLAWNHAMEEMTGIPADRMVGKGDYEYALPFYHERRPITIDLILHDDPDIVEKYPVMKTEGSTRYSEIFIPHLNKGRGAHLWFMASPLYDQAGNLTGAIESIRDITDRKRVEEALSASEELFREVFNNANDAIFLHEMTPEGPGKYILVNDPAVKSLGYTREEFVAMSPTDIVPKSILDTLLPSNLVKMQRDGHATFESMHIRKDGSRCPVEVSTHTFTFKGKHVALSIVRDITERKQIEETQTQLTEFRESVITNARVWLNVLDTRGNILLWNTAAEEISGYRADEVFGKNEIWKLLYPKKEYRKHITDTITRIIHDRKYLENFETVIHTKHGDEKVISWNTKGIPDATGRILNYIAIGVDVTDRHRAEQMLRESEVKFRTVLENVPDLVLVHRNGIILYVNPVVVQTLGYTPDEVFNTPLTRYIVPEYIPTVALAISRRADGEPVKPYEVGILTKAGGRRTVVVRGSLVEFAGSPASINVLTDITERKQAEEALAETSERYRSLFDRSLDCVYIHDFTGNFLDANPSALHLLGYTRDEIPGMNFTSLLTPDQIPPAREVIQEVISTGTQKESSEYRIRRKDGAYVDIETTATLLYHQGKPYAIQGFAHDITERKRTEEKLKKFNEELEQRVTDRTEQINASLEEKVVLLREIHHRVKNNLQIIISLLKLQSRYIDDEKTREAIQESQNRLRAMALVHERIYRSDNIAEINLKDYLNYLTRQIVQFSGIPSSQIGMKISMDDLMSTIDTLVPVGLIVNELVSNSLKHAFPDGRKGEISIAIQRKNATLTILFRDTGIGIPPDLDWRNAESLGLRLVILLVEQLDGTIELDRSSGTAFTIIVKEKE